MKLWKKSVILFFIFVIYLCLSVSIKPNYEKNYDLLMPMFFASNIQKGIPLYEQQEIYIVNGEMYEIPHHMPLYIYFIAILFFIFGESYIPVKISLVIFIFCDALLIEKILKNYFREQDRNSSLWDFSSIIFLLNPISIIHMVYGMFDCMPLLYLLIAIYLLQITKNESSRKSILYSSIAGLSTGVKLSNLALQQRQLEQQAAQQAAAQALAQRQFEQATLPMTQAQIASLQQQTTAPTGTSDLLNILFPQQMTTPRLQFTPEETSTLESLWETDSSPTAVTNGMTRVPQAPRNPLIGRSFT